MKHLMKLTLLLLICMTASSVMYAQGNYKLNSGATTSMKLSGTSSLHKWSMNSNTFNGNAQFNFTPEDAGKLTSLESLSFTLQVLTLKSDKKGLDKNAYKALKTDQYKNILYTLICYNRHSYRQQIPGKDAGEPNYRWGNQTCIYGCVLHGK